MEQPATSSSPTDLEKASGLPLQKTSGQLPAQSLKKSKKTWLILFLGIIFLLVASWFGYSRFFLSDRHPIQQSKELYKGSIILGYTLWPGYLGLYIADRKGYFKDEGLNVSLKRYESLTESYNDYRDGRIQGIANLTMDVINGAYRGLDNKIVTVIDYSNGSDGIIASKGIESIADLKGKQVAFEEGTLEEFFLRFALSKHNLTIKDIKPLNLNPEKSAQALVSGTVEGAVTYEPFMSDALKKTKGKKIYSSAEAPGLITDVLTFRTEFINENPDTIEAIIRAYFRAIEFWKNNPVEANVIIGEASGVSGQEVATQLDGIDILDQDDNRVAFTFNGTLQSIYGNMKEVGKFVKSQQQSGSIEINTDLIIEPKFINSFTGSK